MVNECTVHNDYRIDVEVVLGGHSELAIYSLEWCLKCSQEKHRCKKVFKGN